MQGVKVRKRELKIGRWGVLGGGGGERAVGLGLWARIGGRKEKENNLILYTLSITGQTISA